MNETTWIGLNKYERLVKKYHKIEAGIEPTRSDNRSNILSIKLSDFLSLFPSSRKREEDYLMTLLLLAQVQLPKQSKFILLLRICLSDDSFSCASKYSSH